MTAGLYMAAMGPEGLKQAAVQSMSKAHYLARELCKLPGVEMVHTGEYFHEFVTTMPKTEEVLKALEDNDILGGLPIDGGVLWCATEKVSKAELDKTVAIVKEVLGA
jgi:glycine dehydrogenase subunit 1